MKLTELPFFRVLLLWWAGLALIAGLLFAGGALAGYRAGVQSGYLKGLQGASCEPRRHHAPESSQP